MLLMSGSMSTHLDFTLISPLCTAAPGFGGIIGALSPPCVMGARGIVRMRWRLRICRRASRGLYRYRASVWLTVLCFTALMMEKQPSADSLTLFHVLLPNCSMWAINLSPAIPKQSSNQLEIMSAIDGPAFLFLPLAASPDVLSVSFL